MDRDRANQLAPEISVKINFDRLKVRLQSLKFLFQDKTVNDLLPGLSNWATTNSFGDPVAAAKKKDETDFISKNKLAFISAQKETKKKQMTEQEMHSLISKVNGGKKNINKPATAQGKRAI